MNQEAMSARFFELMNRRELDVMEGMLTEDAAFDFPKTQLLVGRERIRKFFGILLRQYPELTFHVQRIIVHEEHAVVHWKNSGKTRKGEPYENEGVTLFEWREGKIRFISDFFKDTGKF